MKHKGYWNGEPAEFRVVVIVVGEEPKELEEHFNKHMTNRKRYLWFVPYIGREIQAVEVLYGDNKPFYLSNMDGSGVEKVTRGMGSPQAGHYSVYPSHIKHEVPKEHWQEWSKQLAQILREEIDALWTEREPVEYPEHQKQTAALLEEMRIKFFRPNPRKG